jgi:DNA-binding Xre family transcriptional regulator
MSINRQVTYQWRLRETMAQRGLFTAPDLATLLAERGITLSSVQVWRLVTQTPERLSLPVLAALCDVLEVTPADLITTHAENVTAPKAVRTGTTNTAAPAADLASFRPKRARLRRDEDT